MVILLLYPLSTIIVISLGSYHLVYEKQGNLFLFLCLSVFFGEELAFVWEAPYLYDADGFPCFDVQTTVQSTEEGYTVTYSLPEEWLGAE